MVTREEQRTSDECETAWKQGSLGKSSQTVSDTERLENKYVARGPKNKAQVNVKQLGNKIS